MTYPIEMMPAPCTRREVRGVCRSQASGNVSATALKKSLISLNERFMPSGWWVTSRKAPSPREFIIIFCTTVSCMSPSGLVCIFIFVKIEDLPSKFNCSVKDEAIDLDDNRAGRPSTVGNNS